MDSIYNVPALDKIMAWRQANGKQSSEITFEWCIHVSLGLDELKTDGISICCACNNKTGMVYSRTDNLKQRQISL